MEKQLSFPSLSTEETDTLKENTENHMKTKHKEPQFIPNLSVPYLKYFQKYYHKAIIAFNMCREISLLL